MMIQNNEYCGTDTDKDVSMAKTTVPLPREIIPFILQNLEGFDVALEDGERIVITPKAEAQVAPGSRLHLASAMLHRVRESPVEAPVVLRRKLSYRVKDKKHSPEQARAFGLSAPRLLVYTLIYNAGEAGIDYRLIRDKSKFEHGSVSQILNWLQKRNLVVGTPILSK